MRYHFFLHYGWFFQNLGKEAVRTFMHPTVLVALKPPKKNSCCDNYSRKYGKCSKTSFFHNSKTPQSWQVFTLLLSFNLHFQMILSMPTQKQKMEIDYYATLGCKVRILVGNNEAKLFMNSHSIIHNFSIRISNKGLCTKTSPLVQIVIPPRSPASVPELT